MKHLWKTIPLIAVVLVVATLMLYAQTPSLAAQMQKSAQTIKETDDIALDYQETMYGSAEDLLALYTAITETIEGAENWGLSERIPENSANATLSMTKFMVWTVENMSKADCIVQAWDMDHMTPDEPPDEALAGDEVWVPVWNLRERDPWYISTAEADYFAINSVGGQKSTSRDNKFYMLSNNTPEFANQRSRANIIQSCKDIKAKMLGIVDQAAAGGNTITQDKDGTYHWNRTYPNGLQELYGLNFAEGDQGYMLCIIYQYGPNKAQIINTINAMMLSDGNRAKIPTGDNVVPIGPETLEPLPIVN